MLDAGSMSMHSIVQFHAQLNKFLKVLWFLSLSYQASLKFSGEALVQCSLLHIDVKVRNCHQALELSIVQAEFLVTLHELVEFSRQGANLV